MQGTDFASRKFAPAAYLLVGGIACVDWLVGPNVSLGFLYLVPIFLMAPVSSRLHIVLLAGACSVLREAFSPFPIDDHAATRFLIVLLAFAATGMFVREMEWNRTLEVQNEARQRELAEQQSRMLIESSMAAVVIADERGKILLANEAAERLFGLERNSLAGQPLNSFLPAAAEVLATLPGQVSKKMVECTGRRRDGTGFFAQVWTSTFATDAGARLAAIVFDASEELRDRERNGLRQQLIDARVIMGSVWHEVRNYCAAIGAIRMSLGRAPELADRPEIRTLGTLAEGLEKLVARDVCPRSGPTLETVDLRAVLDELRIIIEPDFRNLRASVDWEIPDELPPVQAEHHGLLQVFLNIALNARRALEKARIRQLAVSTRRKKDRLIVEFRNSGPAVADATRLFQPFQKGAEANGLGLYVSRVIARGFGGDLSYIPQARGCCFAVELPAPFPAEAAASLDGRGS